MDLSVEKPKRDSLVQLATALTDWGSPPRFPWWRLLVFQDPYIWLQPILLAHIQLITLKWQALSLRFLNSLGPAHPEITKEAPGSSLGKWEKRPSHGSRMVSFLNRKKKEGKDKGSGVKSWLSTCSVSQVLCSLYCSAGYSSVAKSVGPGAILPESEFHLQHQLHLWPWATS